MAVNPLVQSLKGKLIVSVQAYPGEPMRHPETMAQIARACELGGAAAIRCQGLSDIAAIKGRVEVPVIGLWKEGHDGVYITPTLRHAVACVNAGADVVAIDATDRPRPDGRTFEETVRDLRAQCETIVMADCMTIEDIRRGVACGCDIVSTTLSHNKAAIDTTLDDGPDIALLAEAAKEFPGFPVICEGHVHTPADARAAIDAGAWAVVSGTAITHPTSITSWFKAAIEAPQSRRSPRAFEVLTVPRKYQLPPERGIVWLRTTAPSRLPRSTRPLLQRRRLARSPASPSPRTSMRHPSSPGLSSAAA